jgi:hypothetical protein
LLWKKEQLVSRSSEKSWWVLELTDISQVLQHGSVRSHANEELELVIRSPQPQADDENGQQDGAHGINPPADFGAEDCECQSGAVDEEVVPVVFPENANLAVRVAEGKAVEEEAEFGCEGDGDDDG